MKNSTKIAIQLNVVTVDMIAGACGISKIYTHRLIHRLGLRPVAALKTGKAGRPAPAYNPGVVDLVKNALR